MASQPPVALATQEAAGKIPGSLMLFNAVLANALYYQKYSALASTDAAVE